MEIGRVRSEEILVGRLQPKTCVIPSCEMDCFWRARQQSNVDEAAFVDWLGGYLSGVNAVSLTTNNILGNSDLTAAIYWIDDYCRANPRARFAEAVDARLAPNRRDQ